MHQEAKTRRRDAAHRSGDLTDRETRATDRDFAFHALHHLPPFRFCFANLEKINRKPGKLEHLVSHRKQRTGTQINRKLSRGPRFPFSHSLNPPLAAWKRDPDTAELRPASRPQSHFYAFNFQLSTFDRQPVPAPPAFPNFTRLFFALIGTRRKLEFPVSYRKHSILTFSNRYRFEGVFQALSNDPDAHPHQLTTKSRATRNSLTSFASFASFASFPSSSSFASSTSSISSFLIAPRSPQPRRAIPLKMSGLASHGSGANFQISKEQWEPLVPQLGKSLHTGNPRSSRVRSVH
jgi:hypothetical protein